MGAISLSNDKRVEFYSVRVQRIRRADPPWTKTLQPPRNSEVSLRVSRRRRSSRDYTRRPALLARYGERGRAAYLQDTRFHLFYLADSISFGRPSIFKDYLGWVAEVLSARGVATVELNENLKCVREVLAETLAGDRLAKVLQLPTK